MSLEYSSKFLQFSSGAQMNGKENREYQFKSFLLNVSERQLLDVGRNVALTPKSFDTLVYLIERAGHLVEKEELMQAVWPDSFVEDGNLSRTIHDLRKALGEDKNGNKFIETVPTKGYRFVADVVAIDPAYPGDASQVNQVPSTIQNVPAQRFNVRRLSAILAIGLVVAAGSYFLIYKRATATGGGRRSIAVMPFVNATQDPGRDYLVDGITDSVINQLSRLSGLRVVAGHSIFNYKGKELDLAKVADELGVDALVTGDIKQVEDQLIINVNLIDPHDRSQIWGKQYVKNSLDVIATQNEISQSVAKSLRVNLTEADKRILSTHATDDPEAYQLYLKGRFHGQHVTPDGLIRSIELYSQAVDKDPRFAIAYSEMGMRYVNLGTYFVSPREAMPKARAFAEKALELDNTLSDPHIVLGLVALLYEWDLKKAKEELSNGAIVNLKSMEAFSCTAHALQITGRAEDVDDTLQQALADDPISVALTTELGCNSYYARRYEQSIREYRESLLLGPNNFMAVYGLARTLNHQQQYRAAVDELEKVNTFMPMMPPIAVSERSYSFAKMGNRAEAEAGLKILDDVQSKQIFVDPFVRAIIFLGLDEKDQAFDWLEKAYAVRSSLIPTLMNDGKWDSLRDDPRFQNFIARIEAAAKDQAQNY